MPQRSTKSDRARDGHRLVPAAPLGAAALVIGLAVVACSPAPTPTPTVSPRPTPAATATQTIAPSPTATPEPTLNLGLPGRADARRVSVVVRPAVTAEGGQITVEVSNVSDARIDELVLRWPTPLAETLFLAPFVPDPDLVTEGGGNLVRPWTKWVIGPGEHGEPEGTTSLGYGPIEPGATLVIPLYVTRNAEGPVSFDLQFLSDEDLLTFPDGEPAEVRVEIP